MGEFDESPPGPEGIPPAVGTIRGPGRKQCRPCAAMTTPMRKTPWRSRHQRHHSGSLAPTQEDLQPITGRVSFRGWLREAQRFGLDAWEADTPA